MQFDQQRCSLTILTAPSIKRVAQFCTFRSRCISFRGSRWRSVFRMCVCLLVRLYCCHCLSLEMSPKSTAATVWLLMTIGILQTISACTHWPMSLHRRTAFERCLESRVFPCPLPRGRFPWTPDVFHKFLTKFTFSEEFDEPEKYRPIYSVMRQVRIWVSAHHSRFNLLTS